MLHYVPRMTAYAVPIKMYMYGKKGDHINPSENSPPVTTISCHVATRTRTESSTKNKGWWAAWRPCSHVQGSFSKLPSRSDMCGCIVERSASVYRKMHPERWVTYILTGSAPRLLNAGQVSDRWTVGVIKAMHKICHIVGTWNFSKGALILEGYINCNRR